MIRAALAVTAFVLGVCYWQTFEIWFRADDFAWLGLRDAARLQDALFKPEAQGTVRILSERVFFLAITRLFGPDSAIPFRVVIFATQLLNGVLLALVALRLTQSRTAALLAIPVWLLNPGVAMAMCWISSYNQLLVTACLLGAVLAFLEDRMAWCWFAFLAGFGALEINVVLPAILVVLRPKRWRETLPFFGVSLVYAMAWFVWIHRPAVDPTYRVSFDAALPATLWQYVTLNFGYEGWHRWLALAALLPLAFEWRKCAPGVCWFLLTLAPVLPLKDHISDYYLASASVGLALAAALLYGQDRPQWSAALAAILLVTGWQAHIRAIDWYDRVTTQIETVVRGVREIHARHPRAPIVLEGVPSDVIANAIPDRPFRLYGIPDVRLTPAAVPGPGAVVYRYDEPAAAFLNITRIYASLSSSR